MRRRSDAPMSRAKGCRLSQRLTGPLIFETAAVHERKALMPGMTLDGPALIVEDGTTTVVPQGFTARINAVGQIVLEDVT